MFDFGGVLITSISNQIGDIAGGLGAEPSRVHELLLGPRVSGPEHPWHRAERGEIAVADIQGLLTPWAERLGINLRGDEMERLLAPGGYTVVEAMIDRVRTLRAQGYATGLLTNTFAEFRPTMQRDIDFDLFDVVIESFAVGARKPEPAIYDATRERLGVAHDAIVYLDDFDQNLEIPAALGWTSIMVTDAQFALGQLDEVLGAAAQSTTLR